MWKSFRYRTWFSEEWYGVSAREWLSLDKNPILEENQGTFNLIIDKNGKAHAEKIEEHCDDEISIQTMTTMLMGYKRPEYLYKIGRIKADKEIVEMLENSITQDVPYISDYF